MACPSAGIPPASNLSFMKTSINCGRRRLKALSQFLIVGFDKRRWVMCFPIAVGADALWAQGGGWEKQQLLLLHEPLHFSLAIERTQPKLGVRDGV
jgi:hypothetical protein